MAEHDAPLTPERLERRRKLVEAKVTLEGKPAVIGGIRNKFATVTQLGPHGLTAHWSWEAVERIVKRDGKFRF